MTTLGSSFFERCTLRCDTCFNIVSELFTWVTTFGNHLGCEISGPHKLPTVDSCCTNKKEQNALQVSTEWKDSSSVRDGIPREGAPIAQNDHASPGGVQASWTPAQRGGARNFPNAEFCLMQPELMVSAVLLVLRNKRGWVGREARASTVTEQGRSCSHYHSSRFCRKTFAWIASFPRRKNQPLSEYTWTALLQITKGFYTKLVEFFVFF